MRTFILKCSSQRWIQFKYVHFIKWLWLMADGATHVRFIRRRAVTSDQTERYEFLLARGRFILCLSFAKELQFTE